ncbi:MAG: asparaginase [Firmicutes bacterium]|nr:asparaginase [Bacillota bacterium]
MKSEVLFNEYREDVLENIHEGMVCVVNKDGIVASVGDTQWTCFYRSCSKQIQVLPVIMRELDMKYGLTPQETAIFSGSHCADPEHVAVLESILAKTGLREDQMIMLPTYTVRDCEKDRLLREGKPPRKIYHNCSGKHLAMMLLARELGEPVEQYWVRESKTQQEILHVISQLTDVPVPEIKIGVDGCGVPVYAVPFHTIAKSYLRMMCPELITDETLRQAVERNMDMIHAYPNMISGKDNLSTVICSNPDLCGKDGAMGVYTMGIKSMGLGVVFKIINGSQAPFSSGVIHILRELGYDPTFVENLATRFPDIIINDNKERAGHREAVFSLK